MKKESEGVKERKEVDPPNEAEGEKDGGGRDRGLNRRLRVQEDELDEARQRALKGNLILTSSGKDDTTLKRKNTRLVDHAIELVIKKYGVVVPEDDVVACHRLNNSTSEDLKED